MGTLDYLINSNKESKKGMEYVYLFDMVWKLGEMEFYPIKFGSIVKDVVKRGNDSFEFTDKETNKRYTTNYGWALAENTAGNLEKIDKYLESNEKLKKLEKETNILRDEIIDLDGPSKIK